MGNVKSSINLFKRRKQSFLEQFMKWALTVGRFVIILTETIALAAFLYRFSLDQELIDLHGKIKEKQAIVKLLKENEDTYRSLQTTLTNAKALSETGKESATIYTNITNFASNNISLTNLSMSTDQVKIVAQTQSVGVLTNFIKALKEYPKIRAVSIDKIENKTANATILISITATLKNQLATAK